MDNPKCDLHSEQIKKVESRVAVLEEHVGEIRISQARTEENIIDIKKKIENGLTSKVTDIHIRVEKLLDKDLERKKIALLIMSGVITLILGGMATIGVWLLQLFFKHNGS